MPSLQDLLDADKPYFGNPNITKQGQKSTKLAQLRDVNTLPDPKTYAFISGLAGTAPDEMGFSVLHPDAENIKKSGELGYGLSILSQLLPALKTPKLPTNLSKGLYETTQEGPFLRVRPRNNQGNASSVRGIREEERPIQGNTTGSSGYDIPSRYRMRKSKLK